MAWISPCWLMEPVTAMSWRNGNPEIAEAAAEIGFALDIDESRFSKSRGRGDAYRLAEGISADFQDAQPIHLSDACPTHVDKQRAFLNHFTDARFDEVVALHFRRQRTADVGRADYRFPGGRGVVVRLASQIGDVNEARSHLVSSTRLANAVFQHGGKSAAIEWVQVFFFGQRAQTPRIFSDDAVAHGHFFVEFHAHFENLSEVFLILIEQFVQGAVTDEDDLDVDVDGLGLLSAAAEYMIRKPPSARSSEPARRSMKSLVQPPRAS